jgi:hypothetical protein
MLLYDNNLEIEEVSTMCVGNDVYAPEKKGNEKERPTTRNML